MIAAIVTGAGILLMLGAGFAAWWLRDREPGRHARPDDEAPPLIDPGERNPVVYPHTPREPDPKPHTGPFRLAAGRHPLDGWVADLVTGSLDGLTARQWIDTAFEPAERGVVYAFAAAEQWAATL